MATLQKVSRNWRALFTGPDGRRICRSLGTTDRAKAVKLAADLEGAAKRAREGRLTATRAQAILGEILDVAGLARQDSVTFSEFSAGWLADKNGKAANTITRYRQVLNGLIDSLGDLAKQPPAAIGPQHIEAYRDRLARAGLSASSIRSTIKIAGGIFAKAARQGLIASNPCAAVELDDGAGAMREPFNQQETVALLATAEGDWATAIRLGAFAGLRLSDAVGLTWDNVDLAGPLLSFQPKKTSRRGNVLHVPIHPDLLAHLESIAGDKGGPLCPSLAGRPTGGKSGLSQAFIRLMAKAGVAAAVAKGSKGKRAVAAKSFHSLRHAFATRLLEAGVDEATRMLLCGHATAAMSRKYSHSDFEQLRAAVSKL